MKSASEHEVFLRWQVDAMKVRIKRSGSDDHLEPLGRAVLWAVEEIDRLRDGNSQLYDVCSTYDDELSEVRSELADLEHTGRRARVVVAVAVLTLIGHVALLVWGLL